MDISLKFSKKYTIKIYGIFIGYLTPLHPHRRRKARFARKSCFLFRLLGGSLGLRVLHSGSMASALNSTGNAATAPFGASFQMNGSCLVSKWLLPNLLLLPSSSHSDRSEQYYEQ